MIGKKLDRMENPISMVLHSLGKLLNGPKNDGMGKTNNFRNISVLFSRKSFARECKYFASKHKCNSFAREHKLSFKRERKVSWKNAILLQYVLRANAKFLRRKPLEYFFFPITKDSVLV